MTNSSSPVLQVNPLLKKPLNKRTKTCMFTGSGADACVVIWRAKLHYGML